MTLWKVSHSQNYRCEVAATMPRMRQLRIIASLLVFTLIFSSAQAQTGDWRAVKNIPRGSPISVKVRVRILCIFQSATDDELICTRTNPLPSPIGLDDLRFDRREIREVRLEHSEATNATVGDAIGAGVGAAVGASSNDGTVTRGGGALLIGGIGGIIGGFFGRDFPILHGKIVYRR